MNVVDGCIAAGLAVALILGYRRGLIGQLVSILGLILAWFLAYRYADDLGPVLASWFPAGKLAGYRNYEFAVQALQVDVYLFRALAFVLIFAGVKIGLSLAGHVLNLVAKAPGLNAANRWGGALLALAEAGVIAIVAVYGLSLVPSDRIQQALAASKSAPYAMELVSKLAK